MCGGSYLTGVVMKSSKKNRKLSKNGVKESRTVKGRRAAADRSSKAKKKVKAAAKVSTKKVAVKKAAPKKTAPKLTAKQQEKFQADLILNHRENGRKLARSILRRWRVRLPSEEIDSLVDLALCEAAPRYSPKHGASFMTFLFYHLRGHMVRAVARSAHDTNVPLAMAKAAGIDASDWAHLGTEVAISFLPDYVVFGQNDNETPESLMLRQQKIDGCRDACAQLDSLEREVVLRSFDDEEPLVDIAKNLGYSRCHISRVKRSALDRLKLLLGKGDEYPSKLPDTTEREPIVRRPANRELQKIVRLNVQRLRAAA